MSISITLVRIPGPGACSVQMSAGATVAQLVTTQDLHGRSVFVNGQAVRPDAFANTGLASGDEVFATGAVKGNRQ